MYAAPVPSPISVHMFGLRFTTDCQPRMKKGCPAQRTTGVDNTNSTHVCVVMSNQPSWGPNMASTVTMTVNGRVHQNLREKSLSSGFSSSRLGIKGSSAMPHFGQLPGWSCRISGCMGQVYIVPGTASGSVVEMLSGFEAVNRSGSELKVPRHLALQNLKVFPSWSARYGDASVTCMPHTGSTWCAADPAWPAS